MSLVHQPLPVPISLQPAPFHRKRTSSFSYPTAASQDTAFAPSPRPTKSQRITPATPMGSALRRSETMLVIPELPTSNNTNNASNPNNKDPVPYFRVLQRHKDDRLRRKGLLRSSTLADLSPTSRPRLEVTPPRAAPALPTPQPPASSSSAPPSAAAPKPPSLSVHSLKPRKPSTSPSSNSTTTSPGYVYPKKRPQPTVPPQIILPSASSPITILRTHRTSSPLAPTRTPLPGRPVFPRSKPEPDLYRTAIKMRMRGSPEGLRILHMGPRLALSIMDATKQLEQIVADQLDRDNDIIMGDSTAGVTAPTGGFVSGSSLAMPVLTASWVVVKGEDWEMVDCGA